MKKNKRIKKYDGRVIFGIIVLLTLTISLVVVKYRNKNTIEPQIMTQDDSIIDDDNSEYSLNTEYLPLIRLSKYDGETGDRSGIVITNNGLIYEYAFNEVKVEYPDSDVFAVNQTLYFNNFVKELGNISQDDLTLLIRYCETIDNDYETENMVFDTIGNSISVTNYNKEDIYVLINNEGIINTNVNTQSILKILNKYNISL